MKTALSSLLLLATSLTLSAQTEERIDRRFTVPANGQLVVEVGLGSIDVATHASAEVVKASSSRVGAFLADALRRSHSLLNPGSRTADPFSQKITKVTKN